MESIYYNAQLLPEIIGKVHSNHGYMYTFGSQIPWRDVLCPGRTSLCFNTSPGHVVNLCAHTSSNVRLLSALAAASLYSNPSQTILHSLLSHVIGLFKIVGKRMVLSYPLDRILQIEIRAFR
jgi:hypothetical protein